MYSGYIGIMGMIHKFQLIAAIITYTADKKYYIDYVFVAFVILVFG